MASFQGSVMCDTNVWYHAKHFHGRDSGTRYVATFLNLLELCRAPKLLSNVEVTRRACRQLMENRSGICGYGPLHVIAYVSGLQFEFEDAAFVQDCENFIAAVADGDEIDPMNRGRFRELVEWQHGKSQRVADQFNAVALEYREQPVKIRTSPADRSSTQSIITKFVGHAVGYELIPEQIKWEEVELLLHTMHALLLDFEATERMWEANDINDLFNLAYVGQGELYWTMDRSWVHMIKQARMEHYLYRPPF